MTLERIYIYVNLTIYIYIYIYIQINITPPGFMPEERNWIPGTRGYYSLQLHVLILMVTPYINDIKHFYCPTNAHNVKKT